MTTQGQRLLDHPDDGGFPPGMCDGCYWKSSDDGTWHIVTPNGLHGWLRNHKVVENADGTITVPLSDDGKANSILVSDGPGKGDGLSWHGAIEQGVWRQC